jgi:hypothetical protein
MPNKCVHTLCVAGRTKPKLKKMGGRATSTINTQTCKGIGYLIFRKIKLYVCMYKISPFNALLHWRDLIPRHLLTKTMAIGNECLNQFINGEDLCT